jgi:pimeloyl-ACP methyl ester carboxylesterase
VRGGRIRYFVAGDGPPLLLVHGLGGSAANWCELVPLLAPKRRVVAPDLPGHGGSGPLAGLAGLGAFADRVVAVAEREHALPAPVVGHSLGGLVVLHMALRHPEAVTQVVLAAAAGLSTGSRWTRALLSVFSVMRPGRLVARRPSWIARSAFLRRAIFGPFSVADPVGLTDEAVEGFLGGQALHTDLTSAWRALKTDDPRERLEAIRCPALVLWGSLDAQLPLDDAFEYTRRLRGRLRVIPECGHLLIGERPDACADAILAFT